jgi:hypothetical protein
VLWCFFAYFDYYDNYEVIIEIIIIIIIIIIVIKSYIYSFYVSFGGGAIIKTKYCTIFSLKIV